MTNSHNRNGRNGSYAERYFNNHSPQQLSGGGGGGGAGSGGKRNNSGNSNGGNGGRGRKSPSSTYFRSISASNAIPIVQKSTSPVSSKSASYYSSSSPSGRYHSFNGQRSSPGGGGNSVGSYPGTLSGSPPNFSHFAGSKCYDAPAPTALPKPPVHWTSSSSTSNITISSALNTSRSSANKPTSASVVNARNAYNSKAPSAVSSNATPPSRIKVKSAVKPAMSCATAAAKANRRVDFTQNLKTVLNVRA